jgi:hypothetical protein
VGDDDDDDGASSQASEMIDGFFFKKKPESTTAGLCLSTMGAPQRQPRPARDILVILRPSPVR